MIADTFTYKGSDGKKIFTHKWLPENGSGESKTKAVVQIAHGMAEHSARYKRFAQKLTENNFGVYANDHRGHGQTAGKIEDLGYFADNNGWNLVVSDMNRLTTIIKKNHQNIPVFLFGHSMGSFLSRDYMFTYGDSVDGVILSATAGDPGFLGNVGIIISKTESILKGKKAQSPLLDKLSFGSFNKIFKPNRTNFDWLSRDDAEVDKYVNDPFCGTVFKAGFFIDLLRGIKKINMPSNIQKTPKDLPVYLFSGTNDPVGDFTRGVKKVYKSYEKAGIKDLNIKYYENGRHEMLNETNREEVYKDLIDWFERHLPA
ncbi:MAG: alpha/beta hydrolase [Desulfobacteraceae bacterium]|nr:alpha/beta hydrolase [Desulfobacteraceae bacterium]